MEYGDNAVDGRDDRTGVGSANAPHFLEGFDERCSQLGPGSIPGREHESNDVRMDQTLDFGATSANALVLAEEDPLSFADESQNLRSGASSAK
jgi:hypothetical protein